MRPLGRLSIEHAVRLFIGEPVNRSESPLEIFWGLRLYESKPIVLWLPAERRLDRGVQREYSDHSNSDTLNRRCFAANLWEAEDWNPDGLTGIVCEFMNKHLRMVS